jgi:chemotaxis protein CheX
MQMLNRRAFRASRGGALRRFGLNQESLQRIDGFLASSTQDLFASHGMEIEASLQKRTDVENPLTATIGFTSSNLRGLLVLTLEWDLAAQSLPPNLRQGKPGDAIVADWTGELSNQMLGRLKNRFRTAGIDISLSTPIVFMGKEMRHFMNPAPIHRALGFAEGRILVELQASFDKDFEIEESDAAFEPEPIEGEALFF